MKEDAMGHVAYMEEKRNAYRVLVGKHERNSQLGWPRFKWEDNINLLKPNGYFTYHHV